MARKVKKLSPNVRLFADMILEKGFTKQLEFAQKLGLQRPEFSTLLNGKRLPTSAELAKIKAELKGLENLDENLTKWQRAVKVSIGRNTGTRKKKARKKYAKKATKKSSPAEKSSQERRIKKEKPPIITSVKEATLGQVVDKLNELPGITEGLLLHIMHFFKKK